MRKEKKKKSKDKKNYSVETRERLGAFLTPLLPEDTLKKVLDYVELRNIASFKNGIEVGYKRGYAACKKEGEGENKASSDELDDLLE